MASVYTVRMCYLAAAAGTSTCFTTPADGNTYVLRDICLGSLSAGTTLVVLTINGAVFVWGSPFSAVNQTAHQEVRVVLEPGDVVEVFCGGGDGSVLLTGYRLSP